MDVCLVLDNGEQRNLFPCSKQGCDCIGSTGALLLAPVLSTGIRIFAASKLQTIMALNLHSTSCGLAVMHVPISDQLVWNADAHAWDLTLRTLARLRPALYYFAATFADGSRVMSRTFHVLNYTPTWLLLNGFHLRSTLDAHFKATNTPWSCYFPTDTCTFVRIDDPVRAMQFRYFKDLLPGIDRELITFTLPLRRSKKTLKKFEVTVRDCALRRQTMRSLHHFKSVSEAEVLKTRKRAREVDEPEPKMIGVDKFLLPRADVDRMLSLLVLSPDIRNAFDNAYVDLQCEEELV